MNGVRRFRYVTARPYFALGVAALILTSIALSSVQFQVGRIFAGVAALIPGVGLLGLRVRLIATDIRDHAAVNQPPSPQLATSPETRHRARVASAAVCTLGLLFIAAAPIMTVLSANSTSILSWILVIPIALIPAFIGEGLLIAAAQLFALQPRGTATATKPLVAMLLLAFLPLFPVLRDPVHTWRLGVGATAAAAIVSSVLRLVTRAEHAMTGRRPTTRKKPTRQTKVGNRSTAKVIANSIGAAVLPIFALGLIWIFFAGLISLIKSIAYYGNTPTCNGEAMQLDEICDFWQGNVLQSSTYQQLMDSHNNSSMKGIVTGAALLGTAIALVVAVWCASRIIERGKR